MGICINVPSHTHSCEECGEEWRCYNQKCYYEDGRADFIKTCPECEAEKNHEPKE